MLFACSGRPALLFELLRLADASHCDVALIAVWVFVANLLTFWRQCYNYYYPIGSEPGQEPNKGHCHALVVVVQRCLPS